MDYIQLYFLISKCFERGVFPGAFLLLIVYLYFLTLHIFVCFQAFLVWLGLFYGSEYGLSWRMFNVYLKKMYIQFLGEVLWKC